MPADRIFTLDDFSFDLPDALIAQYPAEKRDESRLFVLNRNTSQYEHKKFLNVIDYLNSGDILVLNKTRVIPARLFFKRPTGGIIETVLAGRLSALKWLVICNRTKKLKDGEILKSVNNEEIAVTVLGRRGDYIEIETGIEFTEDILTKIGEIPLPPYIKRELNDTDRSRYQTIYADKGIAAAAPTAGLHFTQELMEKIEARGVEFVYLMLDVSWGTFQPVREKDLSRHRMHKEYFELDEESSEKINEGRKRGSRIIAVGTTSLRALESSYKDGNNVPYNGETGIFIYPPYKIRSIDAMITNFHTPYSTLLMLVSSFAGYEKIMDAYREAVRLKYRFFSYGDAMLIL